MSIQLYCVGTWNSDPIIPCRNVTLRSSCTINLLFIISTFDSLIIFHQASLFKALLWYRGFKNRNFTVSGFQINHKIHNQATQPQNQVHRKLHNIIQYISIAIKSLVSNSIKHNLPPPKNRSEPTTSPMFFLSSMLPNLSNLASVYA